MSAEFGVFLKAELLGLIFSAITYGIVTVLSGICFHLLQKKRAIYSDRKRIILSIYVTIMVLLSTWALVHSIYRLMYNVTPQLPYPKFFPLEFPLAIWGADGFMVSILILGCEQRFAIQLQVWRCLVLYQDVSKGPRLAMIILLSLVSFTSFGR
jgi:hypothetical protein